MNFFLDCEVNKLKQIKNINYFKILTKINNSELKQLNQFLTKTSNLA